MTDHLDTTLSALDTLGYRVVLESNPYGNEDCYMNPNTNTSEIGHNGIGLPTQATFPTAPNIEDTRPIDVLAARVWGGMRWYYPHIERMVADMKELRSENARLKEQLAFANGDGQINRAKLDDFLARQAVAGGGEKGEVNEI